MESFDSFVETIAALRAPDGCPWDRSQTHASIAHNMVEEAYVTERIMPRCISQDHAKRIEVSMALLR